MEPETEYDPESGVEVEICNECSELVECLRAQVLNLRRFDDGNNWYGVLEHEEARNGLTDERDAALRALEAHQREHEITG